MFALLDFMVTVGTQSILFNVILKKKRTIKRHKSLAEKEKRKGKGIANAGAA